MPQRTPLITATPPAPAPIASGDRSRVMPPIATAGKPGEPRNRSNSRPDGDPASDLIASKTGPMPT